MAIDRDKILKEAKNRGWYLHRHSKHEIYKHKKGGCVTVSTTASKERAIKEIKKDFQRQEQLYH